ncbi:hypothetical protein CP557_20220 [Natrinema ejinorense]|uniref:Uncharacterized protein n=1 Tax=Natrinema ejinorense TaxID=373386 RepID=A0A2A5QPN1_9EURY|nr:hypothetical protein CP557_20220 [Natrinema ejinorense]
MIAGPLSVVYTTTRDEIAVAVTPAVAAMSLRSQRTLVTGFLDAISLEDRRMPFLTKKRDRCLKNLIHSFR